MHARKQAAPTILRADSLASLPWLVHGFSTRVAGFSRSFGRNALNLGFTDKDSRTSVKRNRGIFLKEVGATRDKQVWPLVTLRQIHSDLIHCVDRVPEATLVGDGLVTATPRLLLTVQTADCLPVILIDARHQTVDVLHAGWRGTVK
ncbi:MAG TPA: laccase domain-containing protein, partial [Terriglobales bacterium]|nr:laccase domain-containing protein [Terriglobales bacterium]